MSNLYQDFLKYRDKFGLNGLYTRDGKGEPTQNGALFTLEYLICLVNDSETPDSVKKEEIERLRKVYESLETFPGVSSRVPGGDEFDSMDNTGAIATFSGLFDGGAYSRRSYEHGNTVHATGPDMGQASENNVKYYGIARWASILWCLTPISLWRFIRSGFKPKMFWNNNHPDQFCLAGWHGRSPGHIAYLRMTAGRWIGPIAFLSILVGQFLGCFKDVGDTDARKLPYCDWQFLKNRNILWKLSYKLWCYILMKQYPRGMIDVYSRYYNDPNHPIRQYSLPFSP
jgi:hypothetical protein